jgi:hypothetical protein
MLLDSLLQLSLESHGFLLYLTQVLLLLAQLVPYFSVLVFLTLKSVLQFLDLLGASLALLLYLLVVGFDFFRGGLLLLQRVLQFVDGILQVRDLHVFLELLSDDSLFLLEDVIVEDAHVLQLGLLLAQHALVLLLDLIHRNVLYLQLGALLLGLLELPPYGLKLPYPFVPILLQLLHPDVLLVAAFLFEHDGSIEIHDVHLQLVGLLLHCFGAVVLVFQLFLVFLPLLPQLHHFALEVLSDLLDLHLQTADGELMLAAGGLQALALALVLA